MFMYTCFALDKDLFARAWGKDTTEEKAKQQCLLALKEMVDETPSKKGRYGKYTFTFCKDKDQYWSK